MPKRNQETPEQSLARTMLIHRHEGQPEAQEEIGKKLDRLRGKRRNVKAALRRANATDKTIAQYQAGE
ncbi:hypothetical protein KAR91_57205 [Candidatus Pacearchaeota archaeon]|nr:hypothetical protein [Candidatus Pacearchaeota archaeon]